MSSELGWMLPTSPRTRPKPAGAGSTAPGPHLCLQLLGRLGHQLLQRCLCRLLLLCLQLLHHLVLRGPGQRDGRGRLCFQEATQWGVPCPPPKRDAPRTPSCLTALQGRKPLIFLPQQEGDLATVICFSASSIKPQVSKGALQLPDLGTAAGAE